MSLSSSEVVRLFVLTPSKRLLQQRNRGLPLQWLLQKVILATPMHHRECHESREGQAL